MGDGKMGYEADREDVNGKIINNPCGFAPKEPWVVTQTPVYRGDLQNQVEKELLETIGVRLIEKTAKQRKQTPIATGVIDYFPDALAEVAHCSFVGNEQHNPGTPLHWDRSKSGDESDALMRHFAQRGTMDNDGVLHSAKVAWRSLALLQKEIEATREKINDI